MRFLRARIVGRVISGLALGAASLAGVILVAPPLARAADTVPAGTLFEQGTQAFGRGAFEEAVSSWSAAASAYEREGNPGGRITALVNLAQAQSALGQYRQARSEEHTSELQSL